MNSKHWPTTPEHTLLRLTTVLVLVVLAACQPPELKEAVVGPGYDISRAVVETRLVGDSVPGINPGFVITPTGAVAIDMSGGVFAVELDLITTRLIELPFRTRFVHKVIWRDDGLAIRVDDKVVLLDSSGAYERAVTAPFSSSGQETRNFAVDRRSRIFLPTISSTHYLQVIADSTLSLWGERVELGRIGVLGDWQRGQTSNLVVVSDYGVHVIDVATGQMLRFSLAERMTLRTSLPSLLIENLKEFADENENDESLQPPAMPLTYLTRNRDGSLLLRLYPVVGEPSHDPAGYVIDPRDHSFEPLYGRWAMRSWDAAIEGDTLITLVSGGFRRHSLVPRQVDRP